MALPSSTANWHWRSKDVTPWAKSWFESQLADAVVFTQGKSSVTIDKLRDFSGDAEVGMRKSKLLTIYDLKLECRWAGTVADGSAVEGTLTFPEVSHENGVDGDGEYEFSVSVTTGSSAASDEIRSSLKKHVPQFAKLKFDPFPAAMLETHGKDVKVEGTPSASGAATPSTGAASTTVNAADASAKLKEAVKAHKVPKATNTSVVTVEATFAASASDLFELLTEEGKIQMWSRAAAKSRPEAGSEYSLFGGNIVGKYVSLDKPSQIVQTWVLRSPTWPDDHVATLTTKLSQGSDSTSVTFELSGVPTGQEDEIRGNLNGYYVRGFQSIGYVLLANHTDITPSPSPSSSTHTTKTAASADSSILSSCLVPAAIIGLILAATMAPRLLK